jgi:enoyl-CoA hydratase
MTLPKVLETLRCERADNVALLTLTREHKRNAITTAMVEELLEVLDAVEADPSVQAVVVTGQGKAFCAGAELGHLSKAAAGDETAEQAVRSIYEGFARLRACPLPTVAAVNGPAVGAGMNLALACDVRLAGRRGVFSSKFLALALHPGGGHTWMMRQAVGPSATKAAALFGQDVSGAEAERIGLVWRCVDDELLIEQAMDLARGATSTPRDVSMAIKATIDGMGSIGSYEEALEHELTKQLWTATQPEFSRRMSAVMGRKT